MADALPVVIVAVTVLGALIAIGTLASSGRSWEQIGRGGLSLRDGSDRPAHEPPAGGGRDEEIRQLLEAEVRQLVVARNERRVRQGRAPLDVDAEVARQLRELTRGAPSRRA